MDKHFPTADKDLGLKVFYVWGVDQVDRSGVNRLLDPENYGKERFVADFSFNEQCQTDLLEFCDSLKSDPKYKDLIKRENGLGLTYCFIEELGAYNVRKNLEDCDYVRTGGWKNETWQVDPNEIQNIMPEFLKQKTCYDENRQETISARYQNEIGWNGVSMMFAAVSAESGVLDPFGIDGEAFTRRQYDQFVQIAEAQTKISQSCGGAVIMTDIDEKVRFYYLIDACFSRPLASLTERSSSLLVQFTFMNNQAIYVRSAIQSSILGVAIAFGVLLISTRVFHCKFPTLFHIFLTELPSNRRANLFYLSLSSRFSQWPSSPASASCLCWSLSLG